VRVDVIAVDAFRPSVDPAHDALHAIDRGAVQELLEVGAFERAREELYESSGLPLPFPEGASARYALVHQLPFILL
jgi:hypothetical protein